MKLVINCLKCTVDVAITGENKIDKVHQESVNDKGIYQFNCPNGHNLYVFDLTHKFQLLFESGVYAFIDGYNREAISSICASLERFYEYGSIIISNSLGVEFEQLIETQKLLKNSSERQIGAFYYLYNVKFQKPLNFLNQDKYFAFRNRVVHQGIFPNDDDTIDLIRMVFMHIIEVLFDLATNCKAQWLSGEQKKMMKLPNFENQVNLFKVLDHL